MKADITNKTQVASEEETIEGALTTPQSAASTELYTNWSAPRGTAEKGLMRERDGAVPPCLTLNLPVSVVKILIFKVHSYNV